MVYFVVLIFLFTIENVSSALASIALHQKHACVQRGCGSELGI